MSVPTVDFIPGAAELEQLIAPATRPEGPEFAGWLDAQLKAIDEQLAGSERALRGLATGETSNIHHVLLALEEAKLSFSLIVQVRNKVLEAYQEVMRMQI